MHPLLDPREYTDDQLTEKIKKCNLFLAQQLQVGNMSAVDSIRQVLDTLEFERQERALGYRNDEKDTKPQPEILEFGVIEEIKEGEDEDW